MSDKGDITAFISHISNIWCKKDEDMTSYIFDWMSHLIKFPGIKMRNILVLNGRKGSGKGIIIQILAQILGHQHFQKVNNIDEINESKQKTNLLTFVDECIFEIENKRQSCISKVMQTKNSRQWNVTFPIRIEKCSNYIVAIDPYVIMPAAPDDRIWNMIELDDRYAFSIDKENNCAFPLSSSRAYFKRLLHIDPRHVAHFLYNREVSKNFPLRLY
jgi:energy-coupling factor transporter ATP-binding protein EcfA2